MRTCLFLLTLFISGFLHAQPGKGLVPTAYKAHVILILKDFARNPIPKADVWIEDTGGKRIAEGKTNSAGMWETLAPNGKTYWIGIEDSARYEQASLDGKPYLVTRRTIYFQGSVNGKATMVASPSFNMMPPPDGLAKVNMSFIKNDGAPLVGEQVVLTGLGNGKKYEGLTDSSGCLQLHVPIGENYNIALEYSPKFDQLSFPAHGGSYNVRLKYGYAGSVAIESARRTREINDSLHNVFRLLTLENQRKLRDSSMHKRVFNSVEVQTYQGGAEAPGLEPPQQLPGGPSLARPRPLEPFITSYGYSLAMPSSTAMSCPLYMDGLLITGGGFVSASLFAFDASTGKLQWTVQLGEGGPCAPTGANGVVVVITESCTMYAFESRTGKLLWSKWMSPYVLSAPAIMDGKVFLVYEDKDGGTLSKNRLNTHVLAALDLRTGEVKWQQWIFGEAMSSVVADAGRVYCNTFNGDSYVLDAKNGALLASAKLLATSAPTPFGGKLYMSQRESLQGLARERIAAFDAATLRLLAAGPWLDAPYLDWDSKGNSKQQQAEAAMSLSTGMVYNADDDSHSRMHAKALAGVETIAGIQMYQGSRPVIASGLVLAAMGGVLRAYATNTMAQVWEWQDKAANPNLSGRSFAPPITAGEKVFMAGADGAMRSFYIRTGKPVDIYRTEEEFRSPPIAVNGWLIAGSNAGKVVAVNTHDDAVDGWDCWGGSWGRTNLGR